MKTQNEEDLVKVIRPANLSFLFFLLSQHQTTHNCPAGRPRRKNTSYRTTIVAKIFKIMLVTKVLTVAALAAQGVVANNEWRDCNSCL
ncbi:hypothetical protein CC79DRAFT_1394863, partial [Sarocladium strictum]